MKTEYKQRKAYTIGRFLIVSIVNCEFFLLSQLMESANINMRTYHNMVQGRPLQFGMTCLKHSYQIKIVLLKYCQISIQSFNRAHRALPVAAPGGFWGFWKLVSLAMLLEASMIIASCTRKATGWAIQFCVHIHCTCTSLMTFTVLPIKQ